MKKTINLFMVAFALILLFYMKYDVKAQSIEAEPNNTKDAANALVNGTYLQGNLMNYDDVDFYKVNVPENGSLTISFTHDYIESSSLYWSVILYDSYMNEYSKWTYKGNDLNENTTPSLGVAAGTYYVKVEKYNHSAVNYNLKYNFSSSTSWEREFNDSHDKANVLEPDTYINGNIRNYDDVDFYRISIPQNGSLALSFKHEYIDNTSLYWSIYLYDAYLNEYSKWTYKGNTLEELTTPSLGVAAGTYYVKILKYNYSDVNYHLKYNFTSSNYWEREFNDSYDKANALDLDTYVNGNIRNYDDIDFYKINVPQNCSISLIFKHDYYANGSAYWTVYLYDSYLNEQSHWIYNGNEIEEKSTPNIGLATGTYFIKVVKYNYSEVNYQIMAKAVISVSSITVQGNDNGIIGDNVQLSASILPQNATNKEISWKSDNTSIATVDDNGLVKCISEGKANITAEAKDGSGISGSISFTVKPKPPVLVSSISIQGEKNGNVGDMVQLSATVMPQDAANKQISWSSSDKSIASVDGFGLVECKSEGTVTITAKAIDGSNISSSITFKVNADTEEEKESSLIKKATIKKVTSKGKNVTVNWKKLTNSKKYEIQISTNKKFTKNLVKKTVKSNKQKITIKYKKKGVVYVRVRGIDKNGKAGKWSNVKKYTIK